MAAVSQGTGTSRKYKVRPKRDDGKVHVAIRCRPMSDAETKAGVKFAVDMRNNEEIKVTGNYNREKTYKFDKTFAPESKQIDVYKNVVEPHIDAVLAGYNCTVLAYGQTGSGKTFTMEGERSEDEEYTWENDPLAGIIPRTLSQLFDRLEKESAEFSVHVSLLEIYNELIYDLLSPTAEPAQRRIYDDSSRKGSIIVAEQTEIRVLNKSEIYAILQRGSMKRRTFATMMNEFSSRSHSVFTITVHIKELTNVDMDEEFVKIGKLNLVDLAGSENIGRSGAVDQQAREVKNINRSLLTLSRCTRSLVEHASHVPYRDSSLTRILQDSLGGATKTSIIATISPGVDNLEETLSTLDYASKAKNIRNRPTVNQKMTKRFLIKQYDHEIEKLRCELIATREKNVVYMDQKQYDTMTSRLEELESNLQERQKELANYKKRFQDITKELHVKSEEYAALEKEINQIHRQLVKAVADGQQVVEVAAEVTDSIAKVHDKVDRFKTVQDKNIQEIEVHRPCFNDEVELFNTNTSEIVNASKEHLATCMEALDERKRSVEKEKREMLEMVYEFQSTLKQSVNTIQNTVSAALKHQHQHQQQQHDFLIEKEELMNVMLGNLRNSVAEKITAVQQKCQKARDVNAKIDSFLKQEMEQHHKAISAKAATVSQKLDGNIAETKDFQKDFQKNQEVIMEALKKQVEALKKQFNLVSMHSLKAQNVASDVKSDSAEFSSLTESMKNNLLHESEKVVEKSKPLMHEVEKDFCDVVKQSMDDAKQSSALLSECTVKTQTLSANAMEDLRGAEARVQAASEGASDSLSTFCAGSSHLLREEMDRDNKKMDEVRSNLKSAFDMQSEIVQSFENGTDKLKEMTEEFCSERLTILQPTGNTPARKEYTYPKEFEEVIRLEENEKEEERVEEEGRRGGEKRKRGEEELDEDSGTRGACCSETLNKENEVPRCGGGIPLFMADKLPQETKKTKSRLPMRVRPNMR